MISCATAKFQVNVLSMNTPSDLLSVLESSRKDTGTDDVDLV